MITTVTDNSPQSINTSLFSLDKEVQEIKKVTDKLAGINTESDVISVNGKRGIVELTASDVKALPSSTVIPTTTSELENTSGFITIEDVAEGYVPLTRTINDKPLTSDITLTASDVGSLPDTTVIPSKTSELTNDSGFITESSDITGNAETATTADKVKNALTVNGKTYDGSSAVDAGVQTVENGGTGVTTQADINKAFIGNLETGESDVTDGTEFVSSYASDNSFSEPGYVNTPLRRKFSAVWNYIKDKISSVLGLTKDNYGGKADTAGTADVLANGSGKLKFFYAYGDNSKKLLKLGTFTNGTEASFLLTVKRTDTLGFTGYLTINSNSEYSTDIKQFNGYKSSYNIHEITNGELVFLYRNDNNTNDVYIWCPSYGVVSIILMCGKNPWSGGTDTAVTLTEVSDFSGTLLDKF